MEFTEPFEWSGENDHGQRIQGGRDLATRLLKETRAPGDRRVLIGHSHGGNVIPYALKELVAQGKEGLVDGVVCLATPHVDAKPRPLGESFNAIGGLSAVAAFVAFGYAFGFLLGVFDQSFDPAGVSTWKWVLFGVGTIVVPAHVFKLVRENLRTYVQRVAAAKARELQAAVPPPTPVLAVNVRGDEALLALRIVERTAASPSRSGNDC